MSAMKRPAAVAAKGAPAAKAPKAKVSAKSGPIAEVIKGLACSDLPKAARDMLGDMLAPSLDVCKESRHKFQSKMVEMAEGIITNIGASLQGKVEETGSVVSEDSQAKEEFDGKFTAKEGEVETKHADVIAKKRQLAEAARSFIRAREFATETKAEGRSAEVEATGKVKEREVLAGLLEDLLNPLEPGKVGGLVNRLATLAISDSMMVALPAVLGKESSERSTFDVMVLSSVREELDKRIAAADEAIQNAEPAQAARADALHKAEAALEEVAEQQMDGADAYWKVRGEEEELEKEVYELREAIRELKATSKKHQSWNAKAQTALETFQTGTKQVFEELRDAAEEVVPVPAAPSEVEVAAPEAGEVAEIIA